MSSSYEFEKYLTNKENINTTIIFTMTKKSRKNILDELKIEPDDK